MTMNSFLYRTEDISPDNILALFVATAADRRIVDLLKSSTATILEGSRGVGKSFLLRVAEAELLRDFESEKCIPVYLSFVQSSLVHTGDPHQFRNWILAKTTARLIRTLRKMGLLAAAHSSILDLGLHNGNKQEPEASLNSLVDRYEQSYKNPGQHVDASEVPSVDRFKEAIEDLCSALGVRRIVFFFDEAAHVFRPDAQRAFFTLFRDLRSPWISCNAAVYPGVTSYGEAFQPAHDATFVTINRDAQSDNYVDNMREIVEKQASSEVLAAIEKNLSNFSVLAYAVSGNPRLLLKTVDKASKMSSTQVSGVIKEFYRNDIWTEHSSLVDRYPGHRAIIDWGRTFIEDIVLIETKKKNDAKRNETHGDSTSSIWVHRDAPKVVDEAMRLLCYTGILDRDPTLIKSTRSEIGTRYSINLGCIFALEATPISTAMDIVRKLSKRRFTEFGANHPSYASLVGSVGTFTAPSLLASLQKQLQRPVEVLDLTTWQRGKLLERGLSTVGHVLSATEEQLQQSYYVGPVRSRQMINSAVASVFEYLSG